MGKNLANELQRPALLKRMLRTWRSLPDLNQAERWRALAADRMRLELFGRRTCAPRLSPRH